MSKKFEVEADFNNSDEECDQIVLTLEDDSELTCDVISVFECDGRSYIALLPENDPDGDLLLYRYDEDGDEVNLTDIESDDEFDKVAECFSEMMDEEDLDEFFGDEDE
ncbi:MAG: DUF1292 domain-containing protein [Lachnospiraceae bacterium]|nr:DUF1292 domain-containing protein [Lachnospiraceae bacterium]